MYDVRCTDAVGALVCTHAREDNGRTANTEFPQLYTATLRRHRKLNFPPSAFPLPYTTNSQIAQK